MSRNTGRPLSPHLTVWKWGPAMLVSILHRATGTALAIGGGIAFVWWLVAAASGAEAYDNFLAIATSWFGYLVAVGLTWSFFQHLFSGLRHFVLDTGAGYELKANRIGSILTVVGSIVVTFAIWATVFVKMMGAH